MARKSAVVRASGALVEKIDEYGRSVEKLTGVKVQRQAAAEALIRLGLRAVAKPKVVDPLQQFAAGAERKRG